MTVNKPVHCSEEIERRIEEISLEKAQKFNQYLFLMGAGGLGTEEWTELRATVKNALRALIPSIKQEAYQEIQRLIDARMAETAPYGGSSPELKVIYDRITEKSKSQQ